MSGPSETPPSGRVRLRRKADRGRYDWATLAEVLDAGLVCHVGVLLDASPVVPRLADRIDRLYAGAPPEPKGAASAADLMKALEESVRRAESVKARGRAEEEPERPAGEAS